jgi:mono/diheme cytochrome c family protein
MTRSAWMFLTLLAAAVPQPAAAQQLTDTQLLGRRLFNQSCLECHAKPQIISGMYGPALSRESAGGDEEVMRQVISDGTPRMPGFKYHFEPTQIAAIAQYLKTVQPSKSGGGGKGDGSDD